MKQIVLLLLISTKCFAQSIEESERKICHYLDCINYWDNNKLNNDNDSLSIYNDELFSFLTNFLCSNPASIESKFELATNKNFNVLTSADNKFRVYCWNTQQGGTMQFFRTIYQFKNLNKVVVLPIEINEEDDNGSFCYDLNQIYINDTAYYIISSVNIGSSAVYYYQISIKTISDSILIDRPIIHDCTKIKSYIDYEIDLSNEANRNNDNARDNMHLDYDKKKNLIILPFLDENYKVTEKKIIYKFNGIYFEIK